MSQAKGQSQAGKARHLKNSLEYILNPEKTEMGILTGGNHVIADADFAFEKMLETKRTMEERYGYKKTDGRQGYHFVLSFSPKDNISPETAMEITKKFVEAHIPDYESVYAVHTDKEHLHSHIVFNSVSMSGRGAKYHYKNGDWAKIIQPIVNRLCEEYGLSTIKLESSIELDKQSEKNKQKGNHKNQNYREWQEQAEIKNQAKSKKTKNELVQEDIWECLNIAASRQEFDFEMEKRGYKVYRKGKTKDFKHTAILPPGAGKNTRLSEEQQEVLNSLPEKVEKKPKRKPPQHGEREKNNANNSKSSAVQKNNMEIETEILEKNEKESSDNRDKINLNLDGMDKDRSRKAAPKIESVRIKAEKSPKEKVKKLEKLCEPISPIQVQIKSEKMTFLMMETISAVFIRNDYRKRRKGKYYREYVKFDAVQKRVRYLQGNNITTMEQLEKKMEELHFFREKLTAQKKEIFQERKKYEKVFRLYETLETLRIPAQLYMEGDKTLSKEYKQLKDALAELKKSGMDLEEIKKKHASFREELSYMGKIEHMLKKEIYLCEDIKKESIQSRQTQKRKEYQAETKKKKRERAASKKR